MSKRIRVLMIEDEPAMCRFVRAGLDPEAFELLEATTGREGVRLASTENPQIVLLDLGLPDIDGVELTQTIRQWSNVPIIILSAREEVMDKITALDAGADDYLSKPFSLDELLARLRAALRRTTDASSEEPTSFEAHGVQINFLTGNVVRHGQRVRLTATEYRILTVLAQHPGQVMSHGQLLSRIWGEARAMNHHYLRVYMSHLRRKLEVNPADPRLLLSEHGIGYRLALE